MHVTRRQLGLVASAVLAAGLSAGSALAQTKWNLPAAYAANNYHSENLVAFAEDVKKATGGQLEMVVHSNASLLKLPDILRGVQTGQVPAGEILLGQFGNEDPIFEVDNIPFLAAGFDNAWKLYQAQKSILDKHMQARGLRVLFSVAWPGQSIYTRNAVKSVDELKGIKFRKIGRAHV